MAHEYPEHEHEHIEEHHHHERNGGPAWAVAVVVIILLIFLFWLFGRGVFQQREGTRIEIPEKIEIDTGGQQP